MTYGAQAIENPSLRFGVLFTASCSMVYVLLTWLPPSFLTPFNIYTAKTTAYFLSILGMSASAKADLVTAKGFSARIIGECTSLYVSVLYVSFVAAHKASLRQKITGMAVGIPALALANLFRLTVVFLVSAARPSLFEWVHVYVGHIYMAFCTLFACIAWLRWVENVNREEWGGIYFFIRFLAYASILFFPWIECNDAFMGMLDRIIAFAFKLFHYRLVMPHEHSVYYQTFNIVTYGALILATRLPALRNKAAVLAGGIALLSALHLAFRLCNVLMTAFGVEWAFNISTSVSLIGQHLLPFGLWLAFAAGMKAGRAIPVPVASPERVAPPRQRRRKNKSRK
ncbi:MAG: exosortase H [Syntrophobacteraceae bacterium]